MTRISFAMLVFVILMTGCYPMSSRMNSVSIGMTKQEVISALGSPSSTSAKEGTEYLNYQFYERIADTTGFGRTKPYFVRIFNGKVDSYGVLGDFDSTKTPETKTTIDLNVKK